MANKEGNQCIYMFFLIFNFVVFLSSLGMLACAIYMFVVIDPDNFINYYVLGVSIFMLLITLFSMCKMRKSIHMLCLYIIIQFILFIVVLVGGLVLYFNEDYMKTWAKEKVEKYVNENGNDKMDDILN